MNFGTFGRYLTIVGLIGLLGAGFAYSSPSTIGGELKPPEGFEKSAYVRRQVDANQDAQDAVIKARALSIGGVAATMLVLGIGFIVSASSTNPKP